jgi:hypothetical protein
MQIYIHSFSQKYSSRTAIQVTHLKRHITSTSWLNAFVLSKGNHQITRIQYNFAATKICAHNSLFLQLVQYSEGIENRQNSYTHLTKMAIRLLRKQGCRTLMIQLTDEWDAYNDTS